jgi:hypothetical protein
MHHRKLLSRGLLVLAPSAILACTSTVPPALVEYAKQDLPARNAGAYSTLIPELRGELILKDAAAACSVALAEKKKETEDPACICTHSSQADWQQRCAAWFQTAGGATSPTPAPVADAGGRG